MIETRGLKCRKLLDDLKERRGYPHLMEETLDFTVWRAGFRRGFGTLVRQTTKWLSLPKYVKYDMKNYSNICPNYFLK